MALLVTRSATTSNLASSPRAEPGIRCILAPKNADASDAFDSPENVGRVMRGRVRELSREIESRRGNQNASVVPARPSSRPPARPPAQVHRSVQETVPPRTVVTSQEHVQSYTALAPQAYMHSTLRKHQDDLESKMEAAIMQASKSVNSSRSRREKIRRRGDENLVPSARGEPSLARAASPSKSNMCLRRAASPRSKENVSPAKNNMGTFKASPSPKGKVCNTVKMSPQAKDAMTNRVRHNVIAIEQRNPTPDPHRSKRLFGVTHTPAKVVNTHEKVNTTPPGHNGSPAKVVKTPDKVNAVSSAHTAAMSEARKVNYARSITQPRLRGERDSQQTTHSSYGRCLGGAQQTRSSTQVFCPPPRSPPPTAQHYPQTGTSAVCFGTRPPRYDSFVPLPAQQVNEAGKEPPRYGSYAPILRQQQEHKDVVQPKSPKKSPKKSPVLHHPPQVEVPVQVVPHLHSAAAPERKVRKGLVRCPSAPAVGGNVDPDSPDQIFLRFLSEPKAQETLRLFQKLLQKAGLPEDLSESSAFRNIIPYQRIRQLALGWRAKELLKVLDAKERKSGMDARNFLGKTEPRPLRALIIGGGPVGLRLAIELKLSGHQVEVVEKRMDFSRINRLHLWDWCKHDLKELGVKHFDPPGCSFGVDPDYCHIGIGELQSTLFKVSLLVGVRIIFGHEYLGLQHSGNSWNVQVTDSTKKEYLLPFDVLIGADGANSAVARTPGVNAQLGRVEFGLKKGSAIGLVANFVGNVRPDLRQFSWARQFAETRFSDLERKHGVSLENCVYYRSGLQHYVVMTPTAASLIDKGVFEDPYKEELTAGRNIRKDKVREIAQCAAEHFGLPRMQFAPPPDDAMLFDFSGIKRAQSGCAFLGSQDKPDAMVMLVGDALLEPFWPEGLGIMRGFLSALDAVAAINYWSKRDAKVARCISIDSFAKLKTLCGKTAEMVLQRDITKYSLDPKTRYRQSC